MDSKTCKLCEESKPLTEFYSNGAQNDGVQSYCKPCSYLYRLSRQHGVKVKKIKAVLAGGRCKVCLQKDRKLAVDHNHKTKKIRGLLCRQCNSALGLLGDDPVWVLSLLEYVIETDPYERDRLQKVQLALLDLFSVANDVFTEADAFEPGTIHKSLGRLYRVWRDSTRPALDPEFDRDQYRHEMKAGKKKKSPLGRELHAAGSLRSSTDRKTISEKSLKKNAKSESASASRSAKPVPSDDRASGGPSSKKSHSESGAVSRKGKERGSASGSSQKASRKSQKVKD